MKYLTHTLKAVDFIHKSENLRDLRLKRARKCFLKRPLGA